jgi:hypothetical protein
MSKIYYFTNRVFNAKVRDPTDIHSLILWVTFAIWGSFGARENSVLDGHAEGHFTQSQRDGLSPASLHLTTLNWDSLLWRVMNARTYICYVRLCPMLFQHEGGAWPMYLVDLVRVVHNLARY